MPRSVSVSLPVVLLAVALQPHLRAENNGIQIEVLRNGLAAADVAIVLQIADRGKVSVGVTNAQGQAALVGDIVNLGKVQVQVVVEDCPDQDTVHLVAPGGQLRPEEDGCKRRAVGAFWWSKVRRIVVDLTRGTVRIEGEGINTLLKFGVPAAVVVGVGAAALGGGGNPATQTTTTTPGQTPVPQPQPQTQPQPQPQTGGVNGNRTFTSTVELSGGDPSHDCCTNARSVTQLTGREGSISFTGNGVWVPTTGEFDKGSGRFSTTGRGTVAGFPNVGVRFDGTITQSGQLTGDWTLGTGGELPGGRSITYRIQGQAQ